MESKTMVSGTLSVMPISYIPSTFTENFLRSLLRVDYEITGNNRYLMGLDIEPVPDPRAVNIVRKLGEYVKSKCLDVSDYVHSKEDISALTKLFGVGYSVREVEELYLNTIITNIDEDFCSLENVSNTINDFKSGFDLYSERRDYIRIILNIAKKAGAIFSAGIATTIPAAGIVDNVTYTNVTVTEDMYDDTQAFFNQFHGLLYPKPSDFIMYCDGFNAIDKSIQEPINSPDEVMKLLANNVRFDEKQRTFIGETDVAPTDLAVWMAVGFASLGQGRLAFVDVDDDGRPEILTATLIKHPDGNGNFVSYPSGWVPVNAYKAYVLDPFNIPERYLYAPDELMFTNESWKIIPQNNESGIEQFTLSSLINNTIDWKDVVGKTPEEIGLDVDDRKVHDFTVEEVPGFTTLAALVSGVVLYFGRKFVTREKE